MIPYGRQQISRADLDAVLAVLQSDCLTQGPQVPAFEQAVARRCSVEHAVAVCNATAALHLAYLALGVGPGDRVWTSPITFVATANAARYCGADVEFIDIDPRTYNLSVPLLRDRLLEAERRGTLPKLVVPVHLGGQSCDMRAIAELAGRYGFRVVEDASHAIGGEYLGRPVGSCDYSDIAVFSFHAVKIITTGEGGMALTRSPELAQRLGDLRSHGITRDTRRMTIPSPGGWYYQMLELGFNYRMTDIQAALGRSQLERIDEFVRRRRQLVDRYSRRLIDLPLTLPWQHPDTRSAFHLYPVRLRPGEIRRSHAEVFEHLRSRGIGVNLHYIPVHTQPYYQSLGHQPRECPEALRYHDEAITLPLHAGLTDDQQDAVVAALTEALA